MEYWDIYIYMTFSGCNFHYMKGGEIYNTLFLLKL